jgi:hypothetical protein
VSNHFFFGSTYCYFYSYGERGTAVISSVLNRLFNPITTTSNSIKPLSFNLYTSYILVPYVAHLLIAEDLGCPPEEAYNVMKESAVCGVQVHYWREDDPDIDDIVMNNQRLAHKGKSSVCLLTSY